MEKLTKKQHREIITDLMNENHNVKDLRNIQRVAEIFKEDAELRKEGSVLVIWDSTEETTGWRWRIRDQSHVVGNYEERTDWKIGKCENQDQLHW